MTNAIKKWIIILAVFAAVSAHAEIYYSNQPPLSYEQKYNDAQQQQQHYYDVQTEQSNQKLMQIQQQGQNYVPGQISPTRTITPEKSSTY